MALSLADPSLQALQYQVDMLEARLIISDSLRSYKIALPLSALDTAADAPLPPTPPTFQVNLTHLWTHSLMNPTTCSIDKCKISWSLCFARCVCRPWRPCRHAGTTRVSICASSPTSEDT